MSPRLKKIGDSDLVFSIHNDPKGNVSLESKYLDDIQKKMGISDKYETNGRNVITTHSFRAFFITKVSRKDHNLAKFFTGQKGYMLQYDRLSDEEKLALYVEIEPSLLVSDKARDRERIRSLENKNEELKRGSKEIKSKNKDLKKENKDLKKENKDLKKENKDLKRGNKGLAKKVRELEGTTHGATMGQRPDPQSKTEPFSFDPYKDVF